MNQQNDQQNNISIESEQQFAQRQKNELTSPAGQKLTWVRNLFAGDPTQFYGLAFPSSKLKKDSRSTYWVATIANAINVLTSTPAIFFGFANLGVLGPVLTIAVSAGILKVSNESTSAAAASAKGNPPPPPPDFGLVKG